jgi:hypothetical protein
LAGVPLVYINFQPASVPVPDGYQADYGFVFGDRGNGFSYGWDVDNSANTHVRHVNSDPRYDTLIYMQKPNGGRVWEMAVPDGLYDIHLVSGDPSFVDSVYQVAVNGVLATSGGINSAHPYQEAWRQVTVTDGLLVLTNADGSQNNKINFIEINWIDGGGDGPVISLGQRQDASNIVAMAAPSSEGTSTRVALPDTGEDWATFAVAPVLSVPADEPLAPWAKGRSLLRPAVLASTEPLLEGWQKAVSSVEGFP